MFAQLLGVMFSWRNLFFNARSHKSTFNFSQKVPNNCSTDYYEILGISRNASPNEIKTAYYRLSMKYHPDTHPGEENASFFQKLADAYKTLGSPQKKRIYDVEHRLPKIPGEDTPESIDSEFASEILELNEEIDLITDRARLETTLNSIDQQIHDLISRMEDAFSRSDMNKARRHLNKLRYLKRTKQLLEKKLGGEHHG